MDLKEYGVVQRALLGVSYREIDEEFVEAFGEEYGIRETGGVYVADVSEDGAAKAAGIRKGDVITAIDASGSATIPTWRKSCRVIARTTR